MGFVFHYIPNAMMLLHFAQAVRALRFYNFVCSIERDFKARIEPLDHDLDREIISFYIRYHHLLYQNDTTGSNALIGAWQRKLGHQNLWEDFNLVYTSGPPPISGGSRTRSRPTRASTRKSTGGISAPKPVKKSKPLPRRRSEEHHYFSDSSLTPLPSSDDEDIVSRPTAYPFARDPNDCSVGSVDQGISQNDTIQDVNMDSGDEPPPTPPQDTGFLIDPPYCELANSATSLTRVVQNSVDDPMIGNSVSAASFRSGKVPSRSVTRYNGEKSLSAPAPHSSTAPQRKRGRRTNWNTKKPSKKKRTHVEEATDQPMVIDTPAVADLDPEPEPLTIGRVRQDIAPNEPFIPGLVPIPPILPEVRAPFSTSCANIPLPRVAPASNPDPSLDDLKGPSDTPAVAIPVFPRPVLSKNPPIWAQVRTFF